MKSLSRVSIIGHIAADVDLRQTKSGKSVASFPIATNRLSLDEKGDKKEVADYHRIVAWNKFGETCDKLLHVGMPVFVEGRLENHSFDDTEGKRQYRSEIVLKELNILDWSKAKSGKKEMTIKTVEAV